MPAPSRSPRTPSSVVVSRVVDYEPPVIDTAVSVPSRSVAKRPARHLHTVPGPAPSSPRRQAAAAFTDAALRTVLEVIDQRRSPAQVRPLLMGGLAETVVALSRAASQRHGAAVLRRIRLQAIDTKDTTFEVAAVYSRGARSHAMACRVELVPTLRGLRWQLVELHIG